MEGRENTAVYLEGLQFQLKSFMSSNFEVFALDFILDLTIWIIQWFGLLYSLYIKGSLCNIQFQFLHG